MVLCAKLFSVQVFQGKKHQKTLIAQSQRQEKLSAERGNIFDRNNVPITFTQDNKIIFKKSLTEKRI